jgi:hypothetical protein
LPKGIFFNQGVNAERLFVTSASDLRNFIGTDSWGKDLNGTNVTNQREFLSSVEELRTPDGRNVNYNWTNPVKWKNISIDLNKVTEGIYGSDENTINKLILLNISTLVVEHISCISSTSFSFLSMNTTDPSYWAERWELYKFSYAMAVWAWGKGVTMMEFYNEPGNLFVTFCFEKKPKLLKRIQIHYWIHV